MEELHDVRVLVTGASSGIGAALARLLADCVGAAPGSRSWVGDLADLEVAEDIARTIEALGAGPGA